MAAETIAPMKYDALNIEVTRCCQKLKIPHFEAILTSRAVLGVRQFTNQAGAIDDGTVGR